MAVQLTHQKITEIPNTEPAATPALWNTRYREIDQNFESLASFNPAGVCDSAADEVAKTVQIDGFALSANTVVFVKFSNANTASAPTLDVSATGAKPVYFGGESVPPSYLEANKFYQFVYDGTNWVLTGDVDVRHLYLPLAGGTITGDLTVNETCTLNVLEVLDESTFVGAVTTEGTLTVAGEVTFDCPIRSAQSEFLQTQVAVSRGTAPAEECSNTWSVFDNDGFEAGANRLALVSYSVDASKNATLALYVNKFEAGAEEISAGLFMRWAGESPVIALTHHPESTSNDFSVASTHWTSDLNGFRQPETAYQQGDIVGCAFHSKFYLKCIQAGTTSAEGLDTRNVTLGQEISDGACKWKVGIHVASVEGLMPDEHGNVSLTNNKRWEIADSKIDRPPEKPTYGLEDIVFN